MRDTQKTKEQLIAEVADLRQRLATVDASEAVHQQLIAALHASEARHRWFFETIQEGSLPLDAATETSVTAIILVDTTGQIVYANDYTRQVLGLERSEIIGLACDAPAWKMSDPEGKPIQDEQLPFSLVMRTGQPVFDIRHVIGWPDGTAAFLSINGAPLKDDTEQITYVVLSIQDITERRRAEQTLEVERGLLHVLMDNVPDAIYFKDTESRFIRINQAQARRFGLSDPVQAAGKTDFDFFAEEHARPAYEDEQAIVHSGIPLVGKEEKETWLDGREAWVSTTKMPLRDQEGYITGTFGISRDITERKQAEEEIRALNAGLEQRVTERTAQLLETTARLHAANEQLTELDRMKSEFVSNVSHELRTPLANIELYLSLLERGKPEKHDEYLATLKRESNLLHRLIEDLLHLSSLELGKVQPNLAPTDLNQLVSMLAESHSVMVTGHGLTLRVETEPTMPPVMADARLLTQVLSNLMANATNYTPSGGTITVHTRTRFADGRAWATFSVRDTGSGISPRDQRHLFERFYRGEAARTTGAPGTGLGLAICHEIVRRHGGKITVEGQPGQGSTFQVWLPLSPS